MRPIACGAQGGITLALLIVVGTGSCVSVDPSGTFNLSEVDRRPRLVERPDPACTDIRDSSGIQHPLPRDWILVRVDFDVDRSGAPVRIRARSHAYNSGAPVDADQRDEAIGQVARCRFEPALLDGRPVAVTGMYRWAKVPPGG